MKLNFKKNCFTYFTRHISVTFWYFSAITGLFIVLLSVVNDYKHFTNYNSHFFIVQFAIFLIFISVINIWINKVVTKKLASDENKRLFPLVRKIYRYMFCTLLCIIFIILPNTFFEKVKSNHELVIPIFWHKTTANLENSVFASKKIEFEANIKYKLALMCQQHSPSDIIGDTVLTIYDDDVEIFYQIIQPVNSSKIFYFTRDNLNSLSLDFDEERDIEFDYTNHRKHSWISDIIVFKDSGEYNVEYTVENNKGLLNLNTCRMSGLFLIYNAYESLWFNFYQKYRFIPFLFFIISLILTIKNLISFSKFIEGTTDT